MKKLNQLLSVILLFCFTNAFAQKKDKENVTPLNTGYFSIGLGYGISSLFGDIGEGSSISFTNRFKTAYSASIEKRFGRVLGVGANAVIGQVAENERTISRQLNFQTDFKQFGLHVTANSDVNGDMVFAPYVSAGVSYMIFDVYSDLQGGNNTPYYYWSNGAIMDLPEKNENGETIQQNLVDANDYPRDYTYETNVSESFNETPESYDKNTLVFPVTLGFKFKMFEFLDTRLFGTYNVTQTDFLDNFKKDGNDSYLYAGVSVNYTVGKKYIDPKEKNYDNIDFLAIENADSDGDGVTDIWDECPNSKKGEPVDSKGCELDDDGDGVPNHLDKEPKTNRAKILKGAVDREGRGLTDEQLALMEQRRQGLLVTRVERFYEAPSLDMLKEFDIYSDSDQAKGSASIALPAKFRFADVNSDGIIQSNEITLAIDMFFSGEIDISVSDIMDMIDFFFEQF